MRPELRARWLLVVVLAAAAGCQQRKIEVVVNEGDKTGDYGRHSLRASVQKFRSAPRSPEAFRALAVEIDRLRPAFNQDAADEAERNLAFLALGPMAAQLDKPYEEQMQALALTVWPTALHVVPKKGETPHTYLERACAGSLASECKYVVPEYWSLVLTARVWRRMKNRAREAYNDCRPCKQDPTYAALLEEYDQHDGRLTRLASDEKGRVERDAWPQAGDNAAEWSAAPVLDLVTDPPRFMGEPIDGNWRERVRASRRGNGKDSVLGVHLRPRTEVRHLRAVVQAAGAAGYRTVALQARGPQFPYPMREYRLTIRSGRTIDVRDVDTIQYLVRTLDNAGGDRPVRLSAR